ncbi:MAG: glycerate kinase [Defluviitaleaceae bacterium]|nr:glycerate kinase [Defluviitaleaceae bacterium]
MQLRKDANEMIAKIIEDNMPCRAVKNALKAHEFSGRIYLIAIGKAAWTMARAASEFLGERLVQGIVVTKYEHSQGDLPRIDIFEAGHPVSDVNTIIATEKCIELAKKLTAEDELLFLVSGGGSALFEKPLNGISLVDIRGITKQLLASGADIVEMNIIRKHFSSVKGGKFAKIAEPAKVFSIVLSDVLGDKPGVIASGPMVPNTSTVDDVKKIVKKYNLKLSDLQKKYLVQETSQDINNVKTIIIGSVRTLCLSAAKTAKELGYNPFILTTTLNCEASEAGRFLASIASDIKNGVASFNKPAAIIAGGETVVTLKGKGMGGRNQELAFAAAKGIDGLNDVLIFALGSDGTDGPTDAAGGMVTGETLANLHEKGLDFDSILANNDAYNGLNAVDGLIFTGPTGTNVNDVFVILCK